MFPEGDVHEITDYLYLTDMLGVCTSQGFRKLKSYRIKRVLSAYCLPLEGDNEVMEGIDYVWVCMLDTLTQDMLGTGTLRKALHYMEEAERTGERLMVHCEMGISRSPTLVCAHLMKKNGWTTEQAIEHVKQIRPISKPNSSFRVQLKVFEMAGYTADPLILYDSPPYVAFRCKLEKMKGKGPSRSQLALWKQIPELVKINEDLEPCTARGALYRSDNQFQLKSSELAYPTEKMVLTKALEGKLKMLTNQARLMIFMKGTPERPMCGFSKQMVAMLRNVNAKFTAYDVLGDEEVRQGLKELSDWPTYPQLYLDGELLGGLDVVAEEMRSNPNFLNNLPKVAADGSGVDAGGGGGKDRSG